MKIIIGGYFISKMDEKKILTSKDIIHSQLDTVSFDNFEEKSDKIKLTSSNCELF